MNGSPRARAWELDGYNILQPAVFLFGGSAASGEPGKTCGYLAGPGQVRTRALFVHHWVPNDLFDDAQNEIEMGKREVIDTCKQIVHLQLTSFALILLRCLISLSKIPLQKSSNLASQNWKKTLVSHLSSPTRLMVIDGESWICYQEKLLVNSGRTLQLYL